MFGIRRKTEVPPPVDVPRFALVQQDLVIGTFTDEEKDEAVEVAGVIARATGRDTVVYELAASGTAPLVGTYVKSLEQGWSLVSGASQELSTAGIPA
jgi:hypothetical protein